MYPIHPKLAMDIAISTGIASHRQEWPDDPNGMPRRSIEPMVQDPLSMALRSVRIYLGQRMSRLFSRSHPDAETTSASTARFIPIGDRSSGSDRAKAA